jgi:hypothetical protein
MGEGGWYLSGTGGIAARRGRRYSTLLRATACIGISYNCSTPPVGHPSEGFASKMSLVLVSYGFRGFEHGNKNTVAKIRTKTESTRRLSALPHIAATFIQSPDAASASQRPLTAFSHSWARAMEGSTCTAWKPGCGAPLRSLYPSGARRRDRVPPRPLANDAAGAWPVTRCDSLCC